MYMAWTYYVRRDLSKGLNNGDWKYHSEPESLNIYIDSMAKEKTTLYLVSHNIFFDLQASAFFYWFSVWGWRLDFLYDKGLTYVLILRKGKKTIKAISTTNYFSESLESLGTHLGIEKLSVDLANDTIETISQYCKRDTEIVVKAFSAWLGFIDEHDCGSFGLTRASQSFRAYRHRFLSTPIYVHESEEIISLERSAYMGGRTDAFQIGEIENGPFVCYDINSMYPYIMANHDFPHHLVDYQENPTFANLTWQLRRFAVVAECEIETDEPIYAIRNNGKIIFPVGRFTASLTTPGVKRALESGHLIRVNKIAYYDKAPLFKDYIAYFYDLKRNAKDEGDAVTATMVKVFLNSLYGKFGQSYTETEYAQMETSDIYLRIDDWDTVTDIRSTTTYLMNTRITEGETVNGRDSFVAIAAHVTEYARLLLWDIIASVGRDKVLYCDTDSVYLRQRDSHKIVHRVDATALGALSIEGRYDTLGIYGAKDYATDGRAITKGVPKNATRIDANTVSYPQFSRQATHLREGEAKRFIIKHTTKTQKRIYDKGTVTASGRVDPFVFPPSE